MLAACTTQTQTIETQSPLRALPILQDYDVSAQTGFVPYPQPLARLPQAYYQPWEEIMDHLNSLMASRQLRARIDTMPQLTISHLETYPERQRAYTILCFMAHSYVWGAGLDIAQSIPASLAVPWQAISDVIDIPPVLTYASNDLWNWKLKDPNGPYDIENLSTLTTMTGTSDEDWFDIVSVAVEVAGGSALQPLLDAMQAVRDDDLTTVTQNLNRALSHLQKVGKLLEVFYWRIRKFLAGSENLASLGLPNGLEYKGVNNNERKHLMGATAGQSSLFPALDLIFGIEHYQTSEPTRQNNTNSTSLTTQKTPNALLLKMKGFMPGPHRAFLDHLAQVANLRSYVLSKSADSDPSLAVTDLVTAYDACLHQIKLFRDTHIQIVTRYILTQAKRGPPEGWEDYRVKTEQTVPAAITQAPAAAAAAAAAGSSQEPEEPAIQGTGGSDLMPFLKTNRDETNASKVQQVSAKK
ncbi:hypothetical protein BGZ70_010270 [Mortierella alpina]|uniref:Indoleamine 2,3-dioxygenase n=1 Tax=Mortierella alpina TaxID=64518 RepID=A0A9P6M635_MORAP|nr:hypothetical protein BGZ70_010270 [Mortierella alpina]